MWSEVLNVRDHVEYLKYTIEHFLKPWGYILNGDVHWKGEAYGDTGILRVKDNEVEEIQTQDERDPSPPGGWEPWL